MHIDGSIREIRSRAVRHLTSPHLAPMKEMLIQADDLRRQLAAELERATHKRNTAHRKLWLASRPPRNWLFPSARIRAQEGLEQSQAIMEQIAERLSACFAKVSFDLDRACEDAWDQLDRMFQRLARSQKIWDVTAIARIDRKRERSAAGSALNIKRVAFSKQKAGVEFIDTSLPTLAMQNANGGELRLFPGMLVVLDEGDFALIDLLTVKLTVDVHGFVEEEGVPSDTQVIRYVWAKSNADLSRDRRFKKNYQIPLCRYATLIFETAEGICDAYMLSNVDAALDFMKVYEDFISTVLRTRTSAPTAMDDPPRESERRYELPDPPALSTWDDPWVVVGLGMAALVILLVIILVVVPWP